MLASFETPIFWAAEMGFGSYMEESDTSAKNYSSQDHPHLSTPSEPCRRPSCKIGTSTTGTVHAYALPPFVSNIYIYHGAIRPGCRHGTKNGFATPIEEVHAILELDGQRVQGQEDEFVL